MKKGHKFKSPKIPNAFALFCLYENETPFQFAKRSGLDLKTVYKAYNGKRVYQKTASIICKFSNGKLKMEHFGYAEMDNNRGNPSSMEST